MLEVVVGMPREWCDVKGRAAGIEAEALIEP